jgi:platelet-activating factor acetylhydrolase IB subunit alpha
VLTERQRSDLHAGIYEYLLSRGPDYSVAADAFSTASGITNSANDDTAANNNDTSDDNKKKSRRSTGGDGLGGGGTMLEKKWTAVPRLQRRVLELERQVATNARLTAHRAGGDDSSDATNNIGMPGRDRRMLPRPPATHTLQSHSAVVTSVSLHPVYTMAASASEDGTIKLWDHESGEYLRTLRGHTNVVTCVEFSPGQGKFLASTSTDLSVKIWDVKEFTCVRTLRGHDHTISCVKFVPPPIGAAFLEKNQQQLLQQKQQSNGRSETTGGGGGIDPSEAGSKYIVTASRDATVKFWDLETGFCDHTISDHSDWVRCIAVRRAESLTTGTGGGSSEQQETFASLALVASSGNDRTIYVYDANIDRRTKVCELRGHEQVVEALSFLCSSLLPHKGSSTHSSKASSSSTNSTRDYLASGSRDRTVRLWTVANGGSCLMTFRAHENWVRGVLVHPSGNYIISCGDDRSIRVYDIKSHRCMRTIEDAHSHFVTSLSMHPTLPIMISGGVDHTVKCWQLD